MTEDRDDRESTLTYDDLPEAVLDFAEENGFSPKLRSEEHTSELQSDRKSTRLNSSHSPQSRMPSSA